MTSAQNREEISLRHVAMVAKFLGDNKPKNVTLAVSDIIDLVHFQLICQMLAIFSGLNPKGTYLILEKEKTSVLCSPSL